MFESSLSLALTKWGETDCGVVDKGYYQCWQGFKKTFDPNWKPK